VLAFWRKLKNGCGSFEGTTEDNSFAGIVRREVGVGAANG
jgi:hypothetical protein